MKLLFPIYIILTSIQFSFAQQVISSAGTNATGASGQVSWTVGETVIETFTGSGSILSQGFQQGKLTITQVGEIDNPSVQVYVYPNPVNDKLKIEFSNFNPGKYFIQITDANSRVVFERKAATDTQTIDMDSFQAGIYFLKIGNLAENQYETCKIIKI